MHIEPGLITGAKLALGYATAAAAGGFALRAAATAAREVGIVSFAARAVASTALVLFFFEVLPHFRSGVSEVHLIFGSTLFLMFGTAPAAVGLALGLLLQGLFFEQVDLPQYGMNVTTLLLPLFAIAALAKRSVAPKTAYVDLSYGQVLSFSAVYQAGVVAWVAFWVFFGAGFAVDTAASIAQFAVSYVVVIAAEPLVDLAVLFAAKSLRRFTDNRLFSSRLHHAAA